MKRFRYVARANPQEREEGVLEAESSEAVLRALSRRGLFVLEVHPADEDRHPRAWPLRRLRWSKGRFRTADQALVARQMSDLLAGGLTAYRALGVLAGEAQSPALRSTLAQLQREVQEGRPLSQALAQDGNLLPTALIGSVRAGEASGALEQAFRGIADHLEREDALMSKVRDALIYPTFVAAVGLLTAVVLVSSVLPRLTVLYRDLGQSLPFATRLLLGASDALRLVGPGLLLAVLLAVVSLRRRLGRSPSARLRLGRALLDLPLVGRVLLYRDVVRLARSLGTVVAGGVPVVEALELAAGTAANPAVRVAILAVRQAVHDGQRLAPALRTQRLLAGPLASLVQVGEEGAQLADSLLKAADLYERELERRLKRLTALIEPALILVLGLAVAFLVFAMMLPVLQLDLGVR